MIGVISTDSFRQEEAGQGYVDFHRSDDSSEAGVEARVNTSEMETKTYLFYKVSTEGMPVWMNTGGMKKRWVSSKAVE